MRQIKHALIPFLCFIAALAVLYGRILLPFGAAAAPGTNGAESMTQASAGTITVHYHERPPYYMTGPLGVYGLCVNPAKQAFKDAGIPIQWTRTPASRQLDILKAGQSRDCLIGWFKNPEREKFARYSHSIYRDGPIVALARADNPDIRSGRPLAETMTNPDLILLRKDGYSYGPFVDSAIARFNPAQQTTNSENLGMLEMIHSVRADYFLISEEEARDLVYSSGLLDTDFQLVTFSDMPEGNYRYLLFSRKVETEVIEKVNDALRRGMQDPS